MTAPVTGLAVTHGADARSETAGRAFHTLDALRGLAAVVVVLFHANFMSCVSAPPQGFLAVDLFFVMSGFVIAHRYDGDFARGLGLARFAALRLIRLYPLFLLGTALGLLPSLLSLAAAGRNAYHEAMLAAAPSALLMLPSRALFPALPMLYPLNLVSWSLALEVLVNLAYAAAFRFCSLRTLALVAACGFAGLCACLVRWRTLQVGFDWSNAAGGFARVTYGFAIGVIIRRLRGRGVALPPVPWVVPLAAALAMFCTPPLLGGPLWELAACTLVAPLIVAAAVSTEPPPRLRHPFMLLGLGSYALYSLHVPLIGLFLRLETRLGGDATQGGPAAALGYAALLALACVAAHRCYDQPVRRALARLLRRSDAAPEPHSRLPQGRAAAVTRAVP